MADPFSDLVLDIVSLYADAGKRNCGGSGSITISEHALECAAVALAAHPCDDDVILAALLHAIGGLLSRRGLRDSPTGATPMGATYLESLGFSPRTCALVAGCAEAGRFAAATDPAYVSSSLSEGSASIPSPMADAEIVAFKTLPEKDLCLALRRWADETKAPGAAVPGWEAHVPRLTRALAAGLWAPFHSPLLSDSRRLSRVAPSASASPLGAAGPGFAVVRSWLSLAEVAALRHYVSDEVPALPPSKAFHTYELVAGEVMPSRTEHFAHLPDASGVGTNFLMSGRLASLCSALRGGRPMALYKEKVNYKLRGGGGGCELKAMMLLNI